MKVFRRYTNLLFILMFIFCPFVLGDEWDPNSTNSTKRTQKGSNAGLEEKDKGDNKEFDKIESLFLTGSYPRYTLNDSSSATQALKAECKDNYENIKEVILHLNRNPTPHDNRLDSSQEKQRTAEIITKSFSKNIPACGETLHENYYKELYKKLQKRHILDILNSFQEHSLVGDNYYNENNLDRIKEVKKLEQNRISFYNNCVMNTSGGFGMDHVNKISEKISDRLYSWTNLKPLWDNKDNEGKRCYQRREEMKLLVDELEDRLAKTKKKCSQPANTCIEKLKQKVALLPSSNASAENKKIFFQACKESWTDNQHCCSSSLKECSLYDQVQGRYQQVLSQNQEQCSANNPQLQDMQQDLLSSMREVCGQTAETCHKECETELQEFKKDFLQCFLLPSWEISANYWSKIMPEGKKCNEEIKAIRDEYNRIMDNRQKNRLSKESKGSDIRDCEAGKLALEARIQESQSQPASQALNNLCQEQRPGTKNQGPYTFSDPKFPHRSSNNSSSLGGDPSGNSLSSDRPNILELSGRDFDPEFDSENSKKGQDSPEFQPPPESQAKKSSNKKEDSFEDLDKKFGKDHSEDQFNPLLVRKNSLDSNSNTYSSLNGTKKGLGEKGTLGSFSGSSQRNSQRGIASLNGISEDSKGGFQSKSANTGFFGSQRDIIARLGRGARNFVASKFAPVKIPTVQSIFNVHGEEVNLLEQQKKLFKMFCETHDCNYRLPRDF